MDKSHEASLPVAAARPAGSNEPERPTAAILTWILHARSADGTTRGVTSASLRAVEHVHGLLVDGGCERVLRHLDGRRLIVGDRPLGHTRSRMPNDTRCHLAQAGAARRRHVGGARPRWRDTGGQRHRPCHGPDRRDRAPGNCGWRQFPASFAGLATAASCAGRSTAPTLQPGWLYLRRRARQCRSRSRRTRPMEARAA